MRTFQVVDPSVGETSKADESGFVIFGLDGGNRPSPDIFILDAEGEILDEMALARKAVNNHIRHRCSHLTIEKVAFQAFVANAVEREMTEQHVWVPINLVNPAAKDKQTRARSVSYLFERGHVRIRKDQTQLIEQLKAFPRKGVKKDTVDALVYGLMELVHHWEDVDMANKRAKAREEPEAEKERDEYAIEELAM
jgi:predicted phage terminase large subunit-like protein